MPELTAQDLHEAFLEAREDVYGPDNKVVWQVQWQYLNDNERAAYARMAELLNQKLASQHTPLQG